MSFVSFAASKMYLEPALRELTQEYPAEYLTDPRNAQMLALALRRKLIDMGKRDGVDIEGNLESISVYVRGKRR